MKNEMKGWGGYRRPGRAQSVVKVIVIGGMTGPKPKTCGGITVEVYWSEKDHPSQPILTSLTRLEQEDSHLTQVEINKVLRLVRNI